MWEGGGCTTVKIMKIVKMDWACGLGVVWVPPMKIVKIVKIVKIDFTFGCGVGYVSLV